MRIVIANKNCTSKKIKTTSLIVVMVCIMMVLCGCGQASVTEKQKNQPDYLVLVNKQHKIPEDYIDSICLCDIDNVDGGAYKVEKKTKEAFLALQADLKEQGIEIGVDSAYRSVETQQEIMDEFIRDYGEEYARKTVAIPGTSEHHTGLVIDLVPKVDGEWVIENEDMLKETEIFKQIHKALPENGFILRYMDGKEAITGYDYEPWHIRYVGKEAAREIYESGLTLEEYLNKEE